MPQDMCIRYIHTCCTRETNCTLEATSMIPESRYTFLISGFFDKGNVLEHSGSNIETFMQDIGMF